MLIPYIPPMISRADSMGYRVVAPLPCISVTPICSGMFPTLLVYSAFNAFVVIPIGPVSLSEFSRLVDSAIIRSVCKRGHPSPHDALGRVHISDDVDTGSPTANLAIWVYILFIRCICFLANGTTEI